MRAWFLLVLLLSVFAGCSQEPPEETVSAPAPLVPAKKPAPTLPMPATFQVSGGSVDAVAIKNEAAEVKGSFRGLKGTLELVARPAGGQALSGRLEVALASYDSALELRDDRVKSLFFDVAQHGVATIELVSVDPLPADGVPIGPPIELAMKGTVALHGATVPVETTVAIHRNSPISLEAKTITPISLSIAGFGMNGGLQALIKECSHASVDDAVAVSATVAFAAGAARMMLPRGPNAAPIKAKVKAPIQRVK